MTVFEHDQIPPEIWKKWRDYAASAPPLSPEQIEAIGRLLRRIDERIGLRPAPTNPEKRADPDTASGD